MRHDAAIPSPPPQAAADAATRRTDGYPPAVTIAPELVDRMRSMLPCQSKETVMDVLGISSNTWLKLKRGQPVRSSIVERLVQRIGNDISLR